MGPRAAGEGHDGVHVDVFTVPGYAANARKALIKARKIMFADAGILRGLTDDWGERPRGPLFENIVATEIRKMLSVWHPDVEMSHLRTKDGREIDLVLRRGGKAWLVEVKSGDEVHPGELRAFKGIEDVLGLDVAGKIVLTDGDRSE